MLYLNTSEFIFVILGDFWYTLLLWNFAGVDAGL